jgi:hypothetical protein
LARIAILSRGVTNYLLRNQSIDYLQSRNPQPCTNYYFEILTKLISDDNLTNTLLVFRFISNLFKSIDSVDQLKSNKKMVSFLLNERTFLFNRLHSLTKLETNKNCQVAFSTVLLNFVILLKKIVNNFDVLSGTFISDCLFEFIELLNDPSFCNSLLNWDSESIFRIQVSLGTLISTTDNVIDYAYLTGVLKSLENFLNSCKDITNKSQKYSEKVVKCAKYLINQN